MIYLYIIYDIYVIYIYIYTYDIYIYIYNLIKYKYVHILAWTCAYPCTECRGRDEETTLKTQSLFRRLVTCSNV